MKIARKSLIIALPPLFLLLLAGSCGWYLRSEKFQEFARASLIERIETATGLRCEIAGFQVDVFRGRFLISGLSLSRRQSATGLIGLKVPQIRASLSISSFWHFQVRLHELIVAQPRLELVSGRGGSSWDPEEIMRDLKVSLKLEAAKVRVEDGWLQLNGSKAPFNISLNDLDLEIRYAGKLPSYRIHLGYGRSRLYWERRNIVHGLQLDANVSLQGIEIESFTFRRPDPFTHTILTGSGSMKDWKSPVLLIHTTGVIDARDLVLATPALFEGKGNIGVVAELRHDTKGIYSKGAFTATKGSYRKMSFEKLSGSFEIRGDVLHLKTVTGKIANGTFLANAEIQLRKANKNPNRIVTVAKNVPVIEAGRLLNLPLLNFENAADARTVLTWYGGQELRADCDANLQAFPQAQTPSVRSTLLAGGIRFTYFESGTLIVHTANLLSPNTTVQASGGEGSLFHVQLSTTQIAEALDLVANFSPAVEDLVRREPDVRSITGRYDFDGDVRIRSSSDVEYRGSVAVREGKWRSYRIERLETQAYFHPPRLELHSLGLRSGNQSMNGVLELELAGVDQVGKFSFKGKAGNVSIASLKDFGLDVQKTAGTLSGSGTVRYEQGAWGGDGLLVIEKGSYDGESFDSLQAQLLLANRQLRILKAEARRGEAHVSGNGTIDLNSREVSSQFRLQGLSAGEIPQKGMAELRGKIKASGRVRGTLDKPSVSADFECAALNYESWDFGNAVGSAELKDDVLRGNALIKSGIGNFHVQATIGMRPGYPGRTTVEFENLDVQKILPGKPPSYLEDISTALKGKLDAEGNLDDPASLRIRGEVDGAHFKIHNRELHNSGRMLFSVLNRSLRIESVRFEGEGTNLALSGTVPLDDSPRLDLVLSGNLNLELFRGFEKDLSTEGAATLNIRATGSKRQPQVIGRTSIHNAKLDHESLPFRFSDVQGDLVFSRNLIRLENVRGAAASGSIQLSGTIEHQNAVLRSLNLAISMRNARLPYPKDFRSVANAELQLSGTADAQMLSGEVDVTRMEYVRSFNLLEQLASRGAVQSGPLTTEPYLMGLRLNVEIRSNNGLSIDNELARLRGSMRLMLRGTPAYPSLTGHAEATEGTIFFRGSRFEISHASADFIDRNRINPVLEIRAEADVKTYRLILDAVGEIERLNLNISSDPPMSTVDILSLLTTGKRETNSASAGTGTSLRESQMAGMSAASVLSENLTGVIGKRVQRIFGLESFRVDPFLAGAENDPTARITISERLSKDLVVTFSRNLSTNQEQIVVIEYDLGKNMSVVATRDEDGKYGLDFRFRKRLR